MDCIEVGMLMMKYMDGAIVGPEAVKLNEHLRVCPQCAADYRMYSDIMTGFAETRLLTAPEGFEDRVMRRVAELPSLAAKLDLTIENLMCLVWGGIPVFLGIGFCIAINGDAIMEYLYSYPELAGYAGLLTLIAEYLANLTLGVKQIIISLARYAQVSRYILLIILAVIAAVHITVHRRSEMRH